ncbi:MAG: phage holin family protein [Campylobacteraceae bacterium]|jgi:tryptophan-rich sensory protein|nr:phage holin family protein [Campylobacteraceae bacterium]
MSEIFDKAWFALWVFIIALAGAVVSFLTKTKEQKPNRQQIMAGFIVSLFVAYITFEIIFYFTSAPRLSAAMCGVASWMGTDALVLLGGILTKFVKGEK